MIDPQPVVSPAVGLRVGRSHARPRAIDRYRRLTPAIAATDALAVFLALAAAQLLVHGLSLPPRYLLVVMALAPLGFVCLFGAMHLYSLHQLGAIEEIRLLGWAVTAGAAALLMMALWNNRDISRPWVLLVWVLAGVLVLAGRKAWHAWMKRERALGRLLLPTIIVGTNEEARRLARAILPIFHSLETIGFVATTSDEADAPGRTIDGLPILGGLGSLRRIIAGSGAECVFVASTALEFEQMRLVTDAVRNGDVQLRVSANFPSARPSRLAMYTLGGHMALSVRPSVLTPTQAALKRTFDIITGGTALLVLLPVLVLIGVVVKLTSPGPVLFRQERVGRRGERFVIHKFRTMVVDAEDLLDSLRARNEASGPLFKLRDDPRVTPVGGFLRRWSLDELPQLLDVVLGRMSLVGPRPALPKEVAEYEPWHLGRLEAKPGLTGLWQVSGRSDRSFDDYVRLDLFYLENWSLAYDLFIIGKTMPVLLSRSGAY